MPVTAHHLIRRRQLILQAEGYLELGMPQHTLQVLSRCGNEGTLPDHALFLRGEAYRALGQFQEALAPLKRAAESDPQNANVWLSLGWCYKRTGRIDLAIESLQEALSSEPKDSYVALLHYNLACYWSVAGNKRQALACLSRALALDPDFRDVIEREPDFDPIRTDPTFKSLTSVVV